MSAAFVFVLRVYLLFYQSFPIWSLIIVAPKDTKLPKFLLPMNMSKEVSGGLDINLFRMSLFPDPVMRASSKI